MAKFLNLYKIENKVAGTIGDFITEGDLKDFFYYLKREGKDINDYSIYSLNMQDITQYLDLAELGYTDKV